MTRILLAALLLLGCAAEGLARPLALTDYLDWEGVADPRVSPDGSQVVYTRSRVDRIKDRMASDLWIMNSDGSRNRFLLEGGSNARWSPDGERLLFIKKDGDDKAQMLILDIFPCSSAAICSYDFMPEAGKVFFY